MNTPADALRPEAVVMLKIVVVALATVYLSLLVGHAATADSRPVALRRAAVRVRTRTHRVPLGVQMVLVLLVFAGLCALLLIDDDATRTLVRERLTPLPNAR